MAKFHRFRKDGYVIAFNPELDGNALYEEFETDGDPHSAQFQAPESDETVEAREAANLAAAHKLIARAEAKAKAAKAALPVKA